MPQQLTRGTCEEMCVLSAVAAAPQVEPFHCVCRCSKLFLAVSLIFAVTHMTAVMTLCTFSTTIPMLAWLLGGRWLAANIVLDDMTSSTGVIGGTNHHHHTYFFLFRNTAQIDVNTTCLRFFCRHSNNLKSTGLLRSVTSPATFHTCQKCAEAFPSKDGRPATMSCE